MSFQQQVKINKTVAWNALLNHHKQIADLQIKDQFIKDHERAKNFSLDAAGIFLDYSKNRITAETMKLLCNLAETAEVAKHRAAMFSGQEINSTEKRAVLHTALRNPGNEPAFAMTQIKHELGRIRAYVDAIHKKTITDVVNIGIGGSDLGPAMVTAALTPYIPAHLKMHFVSNVDATHIIETLKDLNPETTLFIVASKTFTTQETLTNAITAREWSKNNKNNFIAVTAKPERAVEFGIAEENIFPFWDWVGGRFSLWSAIGISIAIAIGMDNFEQLLAGAHAMDEHFLNAPFARNMPVILALIGIWNINFLNAATQAVIPYDQYLYLLPAFLQQLEMESNGKRVRIDGSPVDYKTAPIVWGSVGTNGQHAFHQLLMQGTQMVPVDFIAHLESQNPIGDHHLLLYANCLAQSQALMQGRNDENLSPHKIIPGNIPSNTLLVRKLTPSALGALIALYEHKVFVQGIIWQINSFDQWGVELGKHLTNELLPKLQGSEKLDDLDSSTRELAKKLLQISL